MKKPYETPELQIESITVDVVATSGEWEDMGKYTPWH